MALPLTVQTETDLANPIQCPRSMVTDPETETGDLAIEVGRHILIDSLEARRELERKNTATDLEEIHEDSRFTTRMTHKTTSVAHESLTKTWIEAPRLLLTFDTTIEIDMPRRDHEPEAGRHTGQIAEATDEEDNREEMIDTGAEEMKSADPILTEMGTTVGRQRTCQ